MQKCVLCLGHVLISTKKINRERERQHDSDGILSKDKRAKSLKQTDLTHSPFHSQLLISNLLKMKSSFSERLSDHLKHFPFLKKKTLTEPHEAGTH